MLDIGQEIWSWALAKGLCSVKRAGPGPGIVKLDFFSNFAPLIVILQAALLSQKNR